MALYFVIYSENLEGKVGHRFLEGKVGQPGQNLLQVTLIHENLISYSSKLNLSFIKT